MELFIISAQGMGLKVLIWLIEQQDFLSSMGVKAVGIPQAATSLVGDVPEKREYEVELVWKSSLHPGVGRRTIIEQ